MNRLDGTKVFYTDTNGRFCGKRHALIQRGDGGIRELEKYVVTGPEKREPGILTVQIGGEIFYATGKTARINLGPERRIELASYKPDGTATGARIWIDTTGNNVWQD